MQYLILYKVVKGGSMYLNELNKEQANVLLNLVSEFVMSDNNFDKEEKNIMKK